jgi:broad specificity phosphatase PhoE
MEDNKATTILMIRHADVHNPAGVVYGRLPRFRLSDLGKQQAREIADHLSGLAVGAIYASPQLRARQTARIIAFRVGCSVIHVSTLIDEVLTGHQGKHNSIHGKLNFYEDPADPSDESIAMIAGRMERFLRQVRRRHGGQTVIAVSHADPIMILRAKVLGLPLVIKSIQGQYYPTKCSIMQFRYAGDIPEPEVTFDAPVKDVTYVEATNGSGHAPDDSSRTSKRRPRQSDAVADQDGHLRGSTVSRS